MKTKKPLRTKHLRPRLVVRRPEQLRSTNHHQQNQITDVPQPAREERAAQVTAVLTDPI